MGAGPSKATDEKVILNETPIQVRSYPERLVHVTNYVVVFT